MTHNKHQSIKVYFPPFTGIRLYSLFGEHTFGPFIVWNTTVLLSILGLIILYKPLGPISKIKVEKVNVDLTPIIE